MTKELVLPISLGVATLVIVAAAVIGRTKVHANPAHIKRFPVSYVGSLSYSPDGKIIATTDPNPQSGVVTLWDAKSLQSLRLVGREMYSEVATTVFSPDGKRVVVFGNSRFIVCDVKTGKTLKILDVNGICTGVLFHSGGSIQLIVSLWAPHGNGGKAIALYDVGTGKLVWKHQFEDSIDAIFVSPSGRIAAASWFDKAYVSHIYIFNPTTGVELAQPDTFPKPYDPKIMSFSHDSNQLAFPTSYDHIEVWNLISKTVSASISCKERGMSPIGALTFSHDDKLLAFGGKAQGHTLLDFSHFPQPLSDGER